MARRRARRAPALAVPLDPHVQRLLRTLALGAPRTADLGARRDAFHGLLRLADTGAAIATIVDRSVPGGPAVRLYTPMQAQAGLLPGLVFLHGGGFVSGDLETHDPLCRTLAAETGCRIVAVAYRLAPEHPFPAAIEDAEAAAEWVLGHATALGIDPARIGLVGESAGAGLAVGVARRLTQIRPDALALQLLLCPILDWTAPADARHERAGDFLIDAATIAHDLACYLPAGHDRADPRVSPLLAADFSGLPPALIHTAEFDPLHEHGALYADRLAAAGVTARLTCHAGMVHLFHAFGRAVPAARAALRQIGAEVRAALARAAVPAGQGAPHEAKRLPDTILNATI